MTSKNRVPSTTLGDLYNKYLKEDDCMDITEQEFKKAAKLIFNSIIDDIISGKRHSLPYSMGVLYLDKFKLKGLKIDFGATRKLGRKVYFTNFHSNGETFKLKWSKPSTKFKNKKLYKFRLTRRHSRKISSLIRDNKIKIVKQYV